MKDTLLFLPPLAEKTTQASLFENCIRKNYSHMREWGQQTQTDCFRIYDREIPDYSLAIDFYAGRFCVQYFLRTRENSEPPAELIKETEQTLVHLFGMSANTIYWRNRAKSKETRQYEKVDESKEFFIAREYGVKFKINLRDYLDTGLFLDHRETRQIVAASCKGKRLLNLFAYTCSFSVHAALAGSSFTKSVDMSNTYTAWGRNNFLLNALSLKNHPIVRADCLRFLEDEIRSGTKYECIIIDPPTISRSKKMDRMFDIQKDYLFLITKALKLLIKGGLIFFSTNSRKFIFEEQHFKPCVIEEITHQTIPQDFRDANIHRCWKMMLP